MHIVAQVNHKGLGVKVEIRIRIVTGDTSN